MAKFTNANNGDFSLSHSPTFHIVVTGHDLTGAVGFHWSKEHPRAWLINLKYVTPVLREIGSIKFYIHDYFPFKTETAYSAMIEKIMTHESLDKS